MTRTFWLVPWREGRMGHQALLCLPPAGSGCGQFRSWQTKVGDDIAVVGVQLPGRETRWSEEPAASMDDVVSSVVAEACGLLAGRRTVVFGHSFGGLLGYEVVRSLIRIGEVPIVGLVVAACRPPDRWVGAGRGLESDEEALTRLIATSSLSGVEVDPDTRAVLLDALRADARLSSTYRWPGRETVSCDVWAWGGNNDVTVPTHDLAGWREYAGAGFAQVHFPGGHYFPFERTDLVTARLRQLFANPVEEGHLPS
jgi:surfactin synthase thioesterase subunit